MKKLTVIALSLLAAGAALADGGNASDYGREAALNRSQVAASQTSRSTVVAELQRARQAGELRNQDREIDPTQFSAPSLRSRAEVLAELQKARVSGELAQLNSNNPGYAHLSPINGYAGGQVAQGD